MPGGTWFGLETARRGLNVHRSALDIVGQNLANASTTGYSRQEAVISTTDPYTVPYLNSSATPGQFGTGAAVDYIRRVKDEYLDNNVRQATSANGYWADQISVMQRAEACYTEPATDGIGGQIVDFFKSWMDLNNYPQDLGVKSAVVEVGKNLAIMMNTTYSQLDAIEKGVLDVTSNGATPLTYTINGGTMVDQVNQVNDTLTKINDITAAIKKIYQAGQQPNDLLDRRDQLLEQLSHYGPIQVTEGNTYGKPNGELTVSIFGNEVFNSKTNVCKDDLALRLNSSDEITLTSASDPTVTVNLSAELAAQNYNGSLVGLVNARNELIEEQDNLNTLADALKTKINDLLNPSPSGTGYDFFKGSLKNNDFVVNSDLINDPDKLDGSLAHDVTELRDKDTIGNSTFSEYYSSIVTTAGNAAKNADSMASNQAAIKNQITALRDSISGVSTDEELTKMTQFQYGYQASARMITAINDMLDVIINKMGV